uniref:Uncharacterized protein n=1 Tax=Octopus bimaculoides TaxID=37653 RepID=A0A0L8HEQ1_OCTBM
MSIILRVTTIIINIIIIVMQIHTSIICVCVCIYAISTEQSLSSIISSNEQFQLR